MKYNAIIIAGPTASGKSDFAHNLAKKINGAIINCDSVQIYRDIETISASPFSENAQNGFEQIDKIPYKLFSILPLTEHISVADYLNLAKSALNNVIEMGKIPIFVGGTGYYINVLINGISALPTTSEQNRNLAREMVDKDINAVKKMLPKDFTLSDPQRIARALEVFLETGKHLSQWQKTPRSGALIPNAFKILINPDKEILLNQIATRIPKMLNGNALKEAKYILENNLDEYRAIGATQLCKMLRGEISEKEAIDNWIIKTNQYAKRQRTWFRGQYMPDIEIKNIPTTDDLERVVKQIS